MTAISCYAVLGGNMAVSGSGPVVQGALLRNELVRLRRANKVTQEQVAKRLEWSASKFIRIEGGKTGISRSDLRALLTEYGVTSPTRIERLQALARGAKESAWWDIYRGEISDGYLSYVGYEAGASFIRQFQPSVIPGLLQTPEYAEVLVSGTAAPTQVGPAVKLRRQRQEELASREEPPSQYFVLDEAVIRRHVGVKKDPRIMPAQLRRLIDLAANDVNITIVVIPFSAGAHDGMTIGPITLLEFEEGLDDLLYRERGEGPSISSDDSLVTDYRDIFESLVGEALPPEESLELIAQAVEQLAR
ncbi:helix-turn-helix transcriptional regulator [Streptosporangium sp. NPDC023615]|uniref:helix-turn-helix domain-containing protein n=1 Tax=Streptosporangium sp. NPDC023615 TaxID=3154794 RepID=UPI00343C6416